MLSIPIPPLVLGIAGLIPFWVLVAGLWLHAAAGLDPVTFDSALATYAAIIVSFLGGIRWGIAIRSDGAGYQFAVSVIPSLVVWALLAAPEPWRLGGLAAVAFSLGPIDLGMVRAGLAPPWFGRLRLILSTGAGLALALGAMAAR